MLTWTGYSDYILGLLSIIVDAGPPFTEGGRLTKLVDRPKIRHFKLFFQLGKSSP